MKLCSRCHKNPAVIYITKMEGDKTTNEGLCLACAKELGIAPINDMIEKMGITDADIESLNSEMSDFMENLGGNPENFENFMTPQNPENAEEGGAGTFPLNFLSNFSFV